MLRKFDINMDYEFGFCVKVGYLICGLDNLLKPRGQGVKQEGEKWKGSFFIIFFYEQKMFMCLVKLYIKILVVL